MNEAASLFDRVASFPNFLVAARKAVRGKKSRPAVRELLFDLEPVLLGLVDELRSGNYRPGPYRQFTVAEPKPRRIAAAPLRDRLVHHAILNVLEPFFEAWGIDQSYACRPGKGVHAAVARARELTRRHRYYLKGDVTLFFDSVDLAVLEAMLRERFSDERLLALLSVIVRNQPDGAVPGKGIPIGNLTSQHLANFYLGPLDRAMEERVGCRYLRYMDDTLVFADSKEELHDLRATAERVLRDELRLARKERGTFVAPAAVGVPFLGLRIFRGTVRLQHPQRSRFLRGVAASVDRLWAGEIDEVAFLASMSSRFEHVSHAGTYRLRQSVQRVLQGPQGVRA